MMSIKILTFKMIFIMLIFSASFSAEAQKVSELDQKIEAGFKAAKEKKFKEAILYFEESLKLHERNHEVSNLLYREINLPDDNDKSKPFANEQEEQIINWRYAMGTNQALLSFLAFSHQLNGNSIEAEKYIDKVYGLQSVVWGLSWRTFIPEIHRVFLSKLMPDKTANYGKYLFISAGLLRVAGDENILKVLIEAQGILPEDAAISAELASVYLMSGDMRSAKKQAELSLKTDPKNVSVLVDLGTSEWMLGEISKAETHAIEALKIRDDFSGAHALLALTYLEKADAPKALHHAEIGLKLTKSHVFYKVIFAAALYANGKSAEASKAYEEASSGNGLDEATLKGWFLKGKALDILRKLMKK